ncbi:MAG: hypothetical protein QM639_20695 [Rhodocyclaceae bacterium]
MRRLPALRAALAAILALPLVALGEGTPHTATPFGAMAVASDDMLDSLRGGYALPGGLVVSFGIAREIYVNGELAHASHTQIDALGNVVANTALNDSTTLIQRGIGNMADLSGLAGDAHAIVIQNSLDGQQFNALTTIDVRVNSLQLMRDQMMQHAIGDALDTARLR